jgi:hypothetical protein
VLADAATRGTEIVIVASIIGPLTILAIVIFVFFRSARRFDEEQKREQRRAPRDRAGRGHEGEPSGSPSEEGAVRLCRTAPVSARRFDAEEKRKRDQTNLG